MDYVHLQGSEEVGRAGHNMTSAAEQMQRAANQFEYSVDRLLRGLDELVTRFENAQSKSLD